MAAEGFSFYIGTPHWLMFMNLLTARNYCKLACQDTWEQMGIKMAKVIELQVLNVQGLLI